MSIQAPAPKQHEPSPLSQEHEPARGTASQGVFRLGALQDLVDRSPRMLAQRQVVQGVHQRRIGYVGAGLESRPRHADVKPRVRAAFQRIKPSLTKEDQQAFEAAFGEDRDNLSLGHRLIELAHDATEHGEVDLDNEQHVMALFHEVMALERHSLDAYDFSTKLAKEFSRHDRAGLALPDLSPPVTQEEHTQLVKAVGGAFNEMWVRDAVRSVGLRPQGKSEKVRGGDTQVALHDTDHLKKVYTALVRKQRESSSKDASGASATWRERIWDTVYLGAGPAVAYHMVANRLGSDPLQTLVIGHVQPWQPGSRNDRAFKSVNHPLGWISPKRGRADDPTSFADTGEFSAEVAEVLKAHSVLQIDTDIKNGGVRKADAGQAYYEVETGRGTFRARHVVSALGIGKHKPPIKDEEEFERRQASGVNVRVLDMDEFHRQLGKEDSDLNKVRRQRGAEFSIVLAGPNAGVDVAYSATNADIKVTWFAASKPAWVEGFANFKIKTSNLTVVLAYFGDYQRQTGVGVTEGVKVTADADRYDDQVAELLKQAGVPRVLKASDAPDSAFDYLVYAVGPDESASGALDAGLKAALENKDANIPDADHRFTQPASLGGTAEEERTRDDVQLAAGPVEKKLEAALERWYGSERIEREPGLVAKSMAGIKSLLDGLTSLVALPPSATLNLRLRGDDGTSLEVIGAQAARVTGKEKEMAPVIASLGPTVVGNDQLTPSRSRAEASAGVLPAYLGKETGGVDLATDDQVAIAAFVAMAFDLPPLLADYVTRRIIQDRVGTALKATLGDSTGLRPKEGDPASFGQAFREKWTALLKQLETLTQ
jgi:hypothetical protein